jgi:hypothetical protein
MTNKNIIKLPVKKEKGLIDSGTIGGLKYKLFDRGNIHIYDNKSCFKKDCSALKAALYSYNYDKMAEGEHFEIPGAGDTDSLFVCKEKGIIKLKLRGSVPEIIKQLKKILDKI